MCICVYDRHAKQGEELSTTDAIVRLQKSLAGATESPPFTPHTVFSAAPAAPTSTSPLPTTPHPTSSTAPTPTITTVSYSMWMNLILHEDNDIYNPYKTLHTYQDMTYPLSHYYIASSHNTYLVTAQLIGQSSVQRYIDDLTSGCRCVELDCWDGNDGQPVITHGNTMTTKILFIDVIKAIYTYAFKKSNYPVILSLEVHCNSTQQDTMAQILVSILGDLIYTSPPPTTTTTAATTTTPLSPVDNTPTLLFGSSSVNFPSPEQLKNKIIIKGKRSIPSSSPTSPSSHKTHTPHTPHTPTTATTTAPAATTTSAKSSLFSFASFRSSTKSASNKVDTTGKIYTIPTKPYHHYLLLIDFFSYRHYRYRGSACHSYYHYYGHSTYHYYFCCPCPYF